MYFNYAHCVIVFVCVRFSLTALFRFEQFDINTLFHLSSLDVCIFLQILSDTVHEYFH